MPSRREFGVSYCRCQPVRHRRRRDVTVLACDCGEERRAIFEWAFDGEAKSSQTVVEDHGREVIFHPTYSTGTAVAKGTLPLAPDRHHYWELKMVGRVYGTAFMVGVGTTEVNPDGGENSFTPFLGMDTQSWGYSHYGKLYHRGLATQFGRCRKFGQGSIVGLHLDLWRGVLHIYLNRELLGQAFTNLPKNVPLYPMVSSTAAKSGLRLICSQSFPAGLAFNCVRALSEVLITKQLLPPGLAEMVENNLWYLVGRRKNLKEKIPDLFLDTDDEEQLQKDGKSGQVTTKKRKIPARKLVAKELLSSNCSSLSSDEDVDFIDFLAFNTRKKSSSMKSFRHVKSDDSSGSDSSGFFISYGKISKIDERPQKQKAG